MLTYRLYAPGSDVDIELSYYAYVRDEAAGLYLDGDDMEYKAFNALVDGKLPLLENTDQPGEWVLELDTDFTGTWLILPRSGQTDVLLDAQVLRVYAVNGSATPDPFGPLVHLHESYGGFEALKFTDEDGDPVEGAQVDVYDKVNYDLRMLTPPYGRTATDYRGYWTAPVVVAPGATYVLVFSKPGLTTIAVEVTVPGPIP